MRVWLTCARLDRPRVEPLVAALEASGLEVWWDTRIEGGALFAKTIAAALEASDAVIVVWSERSVESNWLFNEAMHGRDRRRLIPLTFDGSESPLGFRQFHTVDLTAWTRDIQSAEWAATLHISPRWRETRENLAKTELADMKCDVLLAMRTATRYPDSLYKALVKIRRRRCIWPTTDGTGIQSLAGEPNVGAPKTQVGQHRRIDVVNRFVDCLLNAPLDCHSQDRVGAGGQLTDVPCRRIYAAVKHLCALRFGDIEITESDGFALRLFRPHGSGEGGA